MDKIHAFFSLVWGLIRHGGNLKAFEQEVDKELLYLTKKLDRQNEIRRLNMMIMRAVPLAEFWANECIRATTRDRAEKTRRHLYRIRKVQTAAHVKMSKLEQINAREN